ncbi:V/A-type H+-transporting ATPase subunit A [Kribbella sp. VKM Ac-2571]|uniref:V-type ATP synthase subunit A n=1 Tax=Kribbella sp. VKM Ac-2571 TaxID=2512222 RepID=UPI00105DE243|nr:V-type ATP synthase subunit A [Kribbella sp. VKM Ac-2571]TDO58760.1 V/A-type H+-transporting ATPase subunit A [Kribbella sp. VKM Ac-2571]
MDTVTSARPGRIRRVNGPLVEATGVPDAFMYEVVELGDHRIPAEVVAIDRGTVTLQAFEYTGGLMAADVVRRTGRPLSARLGPGLLGRVFDGLLRPLSSAPTWLVPQTLTLGERTADRWSFAPGAVLGRQLGAGAVLGIVADAGAIEHRVLVPPGVSGELLFLAGAGKVSDGEVVARVGDVEVGLFEQWPVRRPRPFAAREEAFVPLHTGQRVLDLIFPIGAGSTTAVPGGFGTGKTVLLQQLAKWCDADIIVYVGCGERGNEMADVLADLAELADPRTGGRMIDRTVILANTSNMPMMAREASVFTAMTVAEYFRDMGYHAVVVADSTSRWAEALREFASRVGALPAEEGYPADLSSSLAAFYERAGRVRTQGGRVAAVTVVGAVSPPGGDLTEPVTTATERFVRGVWCLDRDLAYARHYPAVSWSASYSRDADAVAAWQTGHENPGWASRRARAMKVLAEAARLSELAEIVGTRTLPGRERMVILGGRLLRDAVLAQSALSPVDATCSGERGAALLQLVLDILDRCMTLIDRGVAATEIEEFDFGALVRAREEAPSAADLEGCRTRLTTALEALV